MIDFIKEKINSYSAILGLEIHLLGKDEIQVRGVLLKKEKQQLKIEKSYLSAPTLDTILSDIPKETPIAIALTGKGILQKKIEIPKGETVDFLHQALPNANPDDFNYQLYKGNAVNWLCIIRKSLVHYWFEKITGLGYTTTSMNVGVPILQYALPLLANKRQQLSIGMNDITLLKNELVDIKNRVGRPPDKITIAEKTLNADQLVAFSAGFQVMAGINNPLINDNLIADAVENFQFTRLFKTVGWTGLISIFIILLLNFVAFSWLSTKNQKLGAALSYHQHQLSQLDTLKAHYEQKKAFFQQSSMLELSKTSFYADQIGYSVPEEINLKSLKVFPMAGNNPREREKSWEFNKTEILIKGISKRSIILNNWIRMLENQTWVEQVEVLPYKESQDGRGEFELKLRLKPE